MEKENMIINITIAADKFIGDAKRYLPIAKAGVDNRLCSSVLYEYSKIFEKKLDYFGFGIGKPSETDKNFIVTSVNFLNTIRSGVTAPGPQGRRC